MSFVLPGNARTLRFTGETKAQSRSEGNLALGKPRQRRTAPPQRIATPTPSGPVSRRQTFRSGASLVPSAWGPAPMSRYGDESVNDDIPTMAMDRDGNDVMPGAHRAPKMTPTRPAPIPNFRQVPHVHAALPIPMPTDEPVTLPREEADGVPLAVWVIAGIVVGVASFFLAPHLLALTSFR